MFSQQQQQQQTLTLVATDRNGQPRTYRLAPTPTQQVAYRRLAVAILSLDVATLGSELRAARQAAVGLVAA